MPDKLKQVFFDNCMYDFCNFSCAYCRGTPKLPNQNFRVPERERIAQSIAIVDGFVDFGILKLSGYGEITLVRGYESLIDLPGKAKQLITNGSLLLEERIDHLARIPDLTICLSLDGHITRMNHCRTGEDEEKLGRILRTLKYISSKGIPLEINSVLTIYNSSSFGSFLDYLSSEIENFVCFPFPVREFPTKKNSELKPTPQDADKFSRAALSHKYRRYLPGQAYMERLVRFLITRKREWGCYVPHVNIGINPHGDLMACSCGPKEILGNIFTDPESAFEHKARMGKDKVWQECENCFTHYEVLNLFFESSISLGELVRIPTFKSKEVRDKLSRLKPK